MKLSTARGISIGIIVAALSFTGVVVHQRSQQRAASDIIVERWERLGGQEWLKPNLQGARLVIPDRPHSLREVHAWRKGESDTIHRTRTFKINTNAQRMRGPDMGDKPAGTTRIIALGDSVTNGWGVTQADSYPARLEESLNNLGHKVEVLNAGVPANPIPVMADWCRNVAGDFSPDIILWTRRPPTNLRDPYKGYVGTLRQCAKAAGATVVVVLPPVSTFDVRGNESWSQEADELRRRLAKDGTTVIELTGAFRTAQRGRGEILEVRGQRLHVVDQETGREWLQAHRSPHDLPNEIYTLFEQQPDVREALFFDGGHPDVEGYKLMADTIADVLTREVLTTPG